MYIAQYNLKYSSLQPVLFLSSNLDVNPVRKEESNNIQVGPT